MIKWSSNYRQTYDQVKRFTGDEGDLTQLDEVQLTNIQHAAETHIRVELCQRGADEGERFVKGYRELHDKATQEIQRRGGDAEVRRKARQLAGIDW